MHYCSKLSRTDKKIEFLELKLFEDSHFIDDLAKKVDKLKFPSTKYSNETKERNMFQKCIKQNKGEFLIFFDIINWSVKHC